MVTKIILFTVLLAAMMTTLTYNDVFASEPQGVELVRNGNGTVTLSWAAQDDIKKYVIKSACLNTINDDGSKIKARIVLGGDVQSYTFDVADEKSCKVSIRTLAENNVRSDNVKIVMASGESTGKIAAEDVKNFTTRSGNAPAADSTPPTFDSAALDEKTGVLAVTFDETIANENFDLSTADYKRKFSVRSQDGTPEGVAFNPDGTKMFVVGYDTEKIYEYALTTPFDLSSSSYANRSFAVGSEDNSPRGVAFNPDGTKMFVIGGEYEEIHEYELTTPFDVSSSSYTNRSFPVRSEDNTPRDVAFNPAGTKMFVAGYASETIIEYTLSTAFNVSTASYTDTFDVSLQDKEPEGVAFNPSGTKMFVVGDQRNRVYEYALSTPFDLSNVSYTHHFSVGTDDDLPRGVAFSPDGTKMFVVGADSNNVYEYTLATPVDLSKLLISESGSVNGTGTALTGASIETVGNSTSIEIKLTALQLQSALALTTPELDILEAAVSDVSGNEILASYDNDIAVTNSVAAVAPPLAAPTNLSVDVFATAANITWTAPAIPANLFYDISNVSYIVNVTDVADGTTVQHTVPVGTTGHTTYLILDKSYQVTVEAKATLTDSTTISSQPTAAVSFDMPLPPLPDAPTDLLVNVINGTAAEITWTAPAVADNEYYTINDVIYEVTVISSDGADEFDNNTVTDTSYTVTGLTPGESYNVHVRTMIFGIGFFVESSPVSASFNMPAADSTPPTFDSAALNEETGVLAVTWNETVNNMLTGDVDLSKLFISETGSVNGTGTALTGASIETVGNSTSIEIELTEPQRIAVIVLATPELDILAAAVSDVSGNQILASYNNTIAVTNSVAPPPLAAPTNLSWAVQGTTATITWTAPAISANPFYDINSVSYIVYVTDVADGIPVQYTISDGAITTYAATGLTPGNSYEVTVRAQASLTDSTVLISPHTAAVSFAVSAAAAVVDSGAGTPPPLAAPTNLSWAVQGTTATITWTVPAIPANSFYDISNVSYIVYVTDVATDNSVQYTISDGTTTTYAATGLTPGKSYQVTVKAQATLTDSTVLSSPFATAVSFAVSSSSSSR